MASLLVLFTTLFLLLLESIILSNFMPSLLAVVEALYAQIYLTRHQGAYGIHRMQQKTSPYSCIAGLFTTT